MKKQKVALITGVNGQDGSYLADFLLSKDYRVVGLLRYTASNDSGKLANIQHNLSNPNFSLETGDITDASAMWRIIDKQRPDEIYNLAAQSHVGESYRSPMSTAHIDAIGPLNILETIRCLDKNIRFYQASTSEMYGDTPGPQNEQALFSPISPYACAKVFAHNLTATYRKSYDIFACSGILFNHESPRRGEHFVTRKITKAAANILANNQDKLELGRIDTRRDWGFAGDYVEAMWLMLQNKEPTDYVIGTGETHTVKEFVEEVFSLAGLDINTHMVSTETLYRPHDVAFLLADPTKAETDLGWKRKVGFKQLAKMMFENDTVLIKGKK
ncbi:GDP-mannose 4,6-dehydratase [Candidatus Nomurabacteria bacterium]|jgi:GDPmannose 4,6-dehydratase|nr:GDP-mannose 4,6-dehydratase [Candidatus Nomurabacteria bacterium]